MKKSPVGQAEQSERHFRRKKQYVHWLQGLAQQLSYKWTTIGGERILVAERKAKQALNRAAIKLLLWDLWIVWLVSWPPKPSKAEKEWTKQRSPCDDEKAVWQSFILRSLITHQRERNNSYVSQLQPVGRETFHLSYPWVELLTTTKCKIKSIFLHKIQEDCIYRAWYLIFCSVCELLTTGYERVPAKMHVWMP